MYIMFDNKIFYKYLNNMKIKKLQFYTIQRQNLMKNNYKEEYNIIKNVI